VAVAAAAEVFRGNMLRRNGSGGGAGGGGAGGDVGGGSGGGGDGLERRRNARRRNPRDRTAATEAVVAEESREVAKVAKQAVLRLRMGDRVKGYFKKYRKWYSGSLVSADHGDNMYVVAFDDGDTLRLPCKRIRACRDVLPLKGVAFCEGDLVVERENPGGAGKRVVSIQMSGHPSAPPTYTLSWPTRAGYRQSALQLARKV
jgi:hypothetical protein